VSEVALESTTIHPARKLSSIEFRQSISPHVRGDFCDSVGSSPPSIQSSAVKMLIFFFMREWLVANLEIFSLEVGCMVNVTFVGISPLLEVLYGNMDILSSSFQLSWSSRSQ
jgi:hypothetical protein